MTATAFAPPRSANKTALAVVLLMHGAAITALVVAKGPDVIKEAFTTTDLTPIEDPAPPPPKPQPKPDVQMPQPKMVIDTPPPIIDLQPQEPVSIDQTATPPVEFTMTTTPVTVPPRVIVPEPVPEPVRIEPARAKANLGSYVSDADYPSEAIRAEQQGTTRFRLAVTPEGRVSDCTVTGSSGSSALDAATCRIMRVRARFAPARGSDGKPASDTVASAIRWVLPEG